MGIVRLVTITAALATLGACNTKSGPPPAQANSSAPMYAQSSTAFIPKDSKLAPVPIETVTDGTSGKTVVVAHSLPRHSGDDRYRTPSESESADGQPTEEQLDQAAEAVEPALQNAQAAEALDAIRAAEAEMNTPQAKFERAERRGRIHIPGNIVFSTGKATVAPGAGSVTVLEDVLEFLEKHPKVTLFRIEGHTDSVGTPFNNVILSGQRALTVERWLVEHGISSDRIIATGFGDTEPIASNGSASGRAQNRRVEFYVAAWDEVLLEEDPSAGGRIFGL